MTRLRRPGRPTIAVAVATVAVLCWPMQPARHVLLPRATTRARLMARAELAAHAATRGCDPTASLRPVGPPVVAAGSFMAKIRARGYRLPAWIKALITSAISIPSTAR